MTVKDPHRAERPSLDPLAPGAVPANRALAQLRSEVPRLTHRRLYRVLVSLLVLGIVVGSAIAFFVSRTEVTTDPLAQRSFEQATQQFEQRYAKRLERWQACLATVDSAGTGVCGRKPSRANAPQPEWFGGMTQDRRYSATEMLPAVAIGVTMAAAMLAFVLGASSGGAEWSSRSMTLQLLWEPRRLRLLVLKWVALVLVVAATAAVALTLGLALGWLTAATKGTMDKADGRLDPGFWSDLLGTAGRGVVLVVIAASMAYAVAMLVRNTGAALGVAFVYFAVLENAIRLLLFRYGSEPFMLSTNAVASLVPGGIDVPGATRRQPNDSFDVTDVVHLGNGRALTTLLVCLLLLAVPAVISFTRRDVA